MKKLSFETRIFLLLLLFSPVFSYSLTHLSNFPTNWTAIPSNFQTKSQSIFALPNLRYSIELVKSPSQRLFFNKASVIISVFFKTISLLAPQLYFTTPFLPNGLEAIPFFLFPFWFIGLYHLLRVRHIRLFLLLPLLSLLLYFIGQADIFFLFPIAIIYLYFSTQGIICLVNKK